MVALALPGGSSSAEGVVSTGTAGGKDTTVADGTPGTVGDDATSSSLLITASWNFRKALWRIFNCCVMVSSAMKSVGTSTRSDLLGLSPWAVATRKYRNGSYLSGLSSALATDMMWERASNPPHLNPYSSAGTPKADTRL